MNEAGAPPDLFDAEHRALLAGQAAYREANALAPDACRQALGDTLTAYERLLRETRRLVRRSDRAELEMTRLNQRLQELANELEYRATHDALTGVYNRAAIIELVNRSFALRDLALIVLDIDHFKRVNDSFGHPTGDRVIVDVVACLKQAVPTTAHIGRVGGEEFTVVLPGQKLGAALAVAEAVRGRIEAHAFGLPDAAGITASFGVSWAPAGGRFDATYSEADEALYLAKRGGRNRVAQFADARDAGHEVSGTCQ